MTVQLQALSDERGLDVSLLVPTGDTLALVGPNGSGKSSVLAVLAGLLRAQSGAATLQGRTLFDLGRNRETWLPVHARNVALLAQEPLLFPHLSVQDNVAFGPRGQGQARTEARAIARHWLTEVEAEELGPRRVTELSGGQAQRVALARALATQPQLLLLDEPLAALDVEVAVSVRRTLRRVLAGRSAIIVTHDLLDAVLLSDRVAVMEAGRIVEQGPTGEVVRHPRSAFAARLAGLNLVQGTAVGPDAVCLDDAAGTLVTGQCPEALTLGEATCGVFGPNSVTVHPAAPAQSVAGGSVTGSNNTLSGVVTALEPQPPLVRVRVGAWSADLAPHSVADLDLLVGAPVQLRVEPAAVTLYPASGGHGRNNPLSPEADPPESD